MQGNCMAKMRGYILSQPVGTIFAMIDFTDMGSYDAVRKNLSELTTLKLLRRLHKGIYQFIDGNEDAAPKPDADEFAYAVARNNKWIIYPHVEEARYRLSLPCTIENDSVWASTGPTATYQIDGKIVRFIKNNSRFMCLVPFDVAVFFMAFNDMEKHNVTADEVVLLSQLLTDKEKEELMYHLSMAPVRLRPVIEIICGCYGRNKRETFFEGE